MTVRLSTSMLLPPSTRIIDSLIVGMEEEIPSHGSPISLFWIFFLWEHMKSLVYVTPVETEEKLLARVLVACNAVLRHELYLGDRWTIAMRCKLFMGIKN